MMSKHRERILSPNAHTQDDFHLFDSDGHAIKTQTLMWYLEKIRDSLESLIVVGETGKQGNFTYDSLERRLECILLDLHTDHRLIKQLIIKLRSDEKKVIEHVSEKVKHILKAPEKQSELGV